MYRRVDAEKVRGKAAMSLAPCSGCARHIRLDEAACPFCGERFERAPDVTGSRFVLGVSRAVLVFGSLVALSSVTESCSEPRAAVSIYGGPPPMVEDGGPMVSPLPSADPQTDGGPKPIGPAAAYGAPPSFLPPSPNLPPKKGP